MPFTETKVLKQRVRDHLEPARNLGHSDVHGKHGAKPASAAVEQPKSTAEMKSTSETTSDIPSVKRNPDGSICEDCR